MCKSLRPSHAAPRHGEYSDLVHHLLYPAAWQLPHESFSMPVLLEDELLRVLPELREIPSQEVCTSPPFCITLSYRWQLNANVPVCFTVLHHIDSS